MYAREVTLRLKANSSVEFSRAIEKDILPLLRKQKGFADEITLVTSEGRNAMAISFWDRKENADIYSRDTYPKVLKGLSAVVEGTPVVQNYEVSNSTIHKISSHN